MKRIELLLLSVWMLACNPTAENQPLSTHRADSLSALKENTDIETPESIVIDSVKNKKQDILGKHSLSLQWLSFADNKPGWAMIEKTADPEWFSIQGEQRNEAGYLRINGKISVISEKELQFDGVIEYLVKNASRDICRKEGRQQFLNTKNRKYWRLQDMSGCGSSDTDYVDLYF